MADVVHNIKYGIIYDKIDSSTLILNQCQSYRYFPYAQDFNLTN